MRELIGGAHGEMTVTMQYLFQGCNCRVEGRYKDMLMAIVTEDIGHVEMLATMAALLGGMNPQHAIVAGGGAMPADSNGNPWNGAFIVAIGNLLADFRTNTAPLGGKDSAPKPDPALSATYSPEGLIAKVKAAIKS